jgi:hypothetical protein
MSTIQLGSLYFKLPMPSLVSILSFQMRMPWVWISLKQFTRWAALKVLSSFRVERFSWIIANAVYPSILLGKYSSCTYRLCDRLMFVKRWYTNYV